MHICMIAREYPPNAAGIGYHVYHLSKKLLDRGHKVDVITRNIPGESLIEYAEGIRIFRAPFNRFLYPFNIFLHGIYVNKLLKLLESKLTLVHMHSPLPPPIKTSLPVIVTIHSPCKRSFQNYYRDSSNMFSIAEQLQSMIIYPFIETNILKISKKVITVSPNVSEEMSAYGLNPKRLTVVGNAVDEKLFIPQNSKFDSNPIILFVGILRSGKGVFDLLSCAKYICKKRSDISFIICGTGPLLKDLKDSTYKLGLQEHINFIGREEDREKLVKLYQKATLLIQPSYHEGLSTVVLEAMSCGLPVVAYNIPGNSSVISNGINGFLVPPKSPKALAESILVLLENTFLREKIGRAARTTIEKFYSWDRITDNVLECYEKLLKRNET